MESCYAYFHGNSSSSVDQICEKAIFCPQHIFFSVLQPDFFSANKLPKAMRQIDDMAKRRGIMLRLLSW